MAQVNETVTDTLSVLTQEADSLARSALDTIPPVWGVTLEKPVPYPDAPEPDTSMSWLFAGLLF